MYIWTAFLFGSFAVIFCVWARKICARARPATRHEVVAFCALLLFQYPFVFALERGNTDTVNLLFYTLGAFLFVRGGSGWRGCRRGWRLGSSCRRSSRSSS